MTGGPRFGVLMRDLRVQMVNCSASGCLLLANASIPVGTTGSLAMELDGMAATDGIQVVRCQPVEGAGTLYHVGARFLWTDTPRKGSIRHFFANRHGLTVPAAAVLTTT